MLGKESISILDHHKLIHSQVRGYLVLDSPDIDEKDYYPFLPPLGLSIKIQALISPPYPFFPFPITVMLYCLNCYISVCWNVSVEWGMMCSVGKPVM